MKERHPFALTFARGPRTTSGFVESQLGNESKVGFTHHRLSPVFTSKLPLSFLRRSHPAQSTHTATTVVTPEPPLQLPELPFRRNEIRLHHHHNSFPRSHQTHRSSTASPRVYLHTPQRELERQESRPPPSRRSYGRRLSLPTTSHPPVVDSALQMPVSVESFSPPSTRASLRSIATDSLALGNVLEKAHVDRSVRE